MKRHPTPLWTDRDIYALMEPEARHILGASGPIDFPHLRMQGRGETPEAVYEALSAALGADLRPLAQVERTWRTRLAPLMNTITTSPHPHEALRFLGYRAMQAVVATRPEFQGEAGAFGMYLLSNALWLADEIQRAGIQRLNFLARDGYLVKAAFEQVCAALHLPVETGYVRISRQAAFPLHFRTESDLLQLPLLVDPAAHTPRTLLALFAPVVDEAQAAAALAECGLPPDKLLDGAGVARFIQVFRTRLYDAARFAAYRDWARAYLVPHFPDRSATYDVGYNLRSEALIAELTGADITAFITHTDSDLPDRRGVAYRTLYPASPYVSWVVREQFLLSKGDPPCIRYGEHGPVLGSAPDPCPEIKRTQRSALNYVRLVVDTFGEDLARLPFRPVDGCAPFEAFLHRAPRRDMLAYRPSAFENDFHDGPKGDDAAFLQWRLMQTDYRRHVLHEPAAWVRFRRACIRLRESPGTFLKKLKH